MVLYVSKTVTFMKKGQKKGNGLYVKGMMRMSGPDITSMYLSDSDRQTIAKLIVAGKVKGFVDGQTTEGEDYRVIWELKTTKNF